MESELASEESDIVTCDFALRLLLYTYDEEAVPGLADRTPLAFCSSFCDVGPTPVSIAAGRPEGFAARVWSNAKLTSGESPTSFCRVGLLMPMQFLLVGPSSATRAPITMDVSVVRPSMSHAEQVLPPIVRTAGPSSNAAETEMVMPSRALRICKEAKASDALSSPRQIKLLV